MDKKNIYDDNFFRRQVDGSYTSAQIIVPLIQQIINPESVVDLGCGLGTWLKVWQERGVSIILGVDGDYIDREKLYIDHHNFLSHDLVTPLNLDRRFDLALSLEVAEHLPAAKADSFIANLTDLADVIVFSAAVPGQGDVGIGHINEQWPEYWQALFEQHGYALLDPFRAEIWRDERVAWWYRQNILLAVKQECLVQTRFKSLPVYVSDHRLINRGEVIA